MVRKQTYSVEIGGNKQCFINIYVHVANTHSLKSLSEWLTPDHNLVTCSTFLEVLIWFKWGHNDVLCSQNWVPADVVNIASFNTSSSNNIQNFTTDIFKIIFSKTESMKKGLTSVKQKNEMLCAIFYHLQKFKNVKNTHGGVLVKLQASGWWWIFSLSLILGCISQSYLR